jgi:dihydrofolate reductase
MSKTVWHITMSLDGYIAGPDHAMEWAFGHAEHSPLADDIRDSTGAILGGRGWYDGATAHHDGVAGIYGGDWTGPVFVLTHRPAELARDETVTALGGPLGGALATAREAAGGLAVGIFGANLARQCIEADALDEIVVHVAPVLLGDGIRLYGDGAPQVALERCDLAESGQLSDLRFRVVREG